MVTKIVPVEKIVGLTGNVHVSCSVDFGCRYEPEESEA
jgi:hypothetical protein